MLQRAGLFLLIALVAGALGFAGGPAASLASINQTLACVFGVVALVSLVLGLARRPY